VICAAPYFLAPGAQALQNGFTQVYELKFLLSLKRKAKQKMKKHPEATPWALNTFKAKTLEDFDHYWTAPSFGFQSSDDYYAQASSAPYLKNISVPTLALHAANDPIVVPECVPEDFLNDNLNIRFEKYPFGGHMGFWEKEPNWLSQQIINFLDQKKAGL
jgi:predicted alpha/beta-fold hydrolase